MNVFFVFTGSHGGRPLISVTALLTEIRAYRQSPESGTRYECQLSVQGSPDRYTVTRCVYDDFHAAIRDHANGAHLVDCYDDTVYDALA